ncbi:MAG: hypothetical protein RID09_13130 [Coleofasciculus sp. G1-WW12-02]|uniref:hypothetical protein n=1 Tax=Coleofasciculus sp. G1-WW12-02 TaxID=3068483 RepID=UPI0032FEFDF6
MLNREGLLPGEGAVGRYADLLKTGRRGDNLTPHHIPSNAFMAAKVPGCTRAIAFGDGEDCDRASLLSPDTPSHQE